MEPVATTEALRLVLKQALDPLVALVLGASRAIGILLILPVLTRAQVAALLRTAVALALALPVLGHTSAAIAQLGGRPDRALQIVLIAIKEVGVGALIGFLLGTPFWTIQIVGELIDMQRSIVNSVQSSDLASGSEATVLNSLLWFVAIVVFIASDGLGIVVRTLYESYSVWPLVRFLPSISLDGVYALVGLLDHMLRQAFLIAGPAVVLLLLVDLSVMLIGRFTPSLNVSDLAPTIKNIAFIVFMLLYAGYLLNYVGAEVAGTRGVTEELEGVVQ
ncbi:MAG: type III secretion system export apparatus subunit SctT [Hyphomicrobiaceae bacterium]|nr:type III secretion system export apparatus subunit SctT [Hyphomicrobiaceae bacterium]